MLLQALRPRAGVDLLQLKGQLDGRGWKAALPASLPDRMLLQLARDFRGFEVNATGESGDDVDFAGPLYLVVNLLSAHGAPSQDADDALEMSEATLLGAMQAYQWALEREIVTRIVGVGATRDAASLLQALQEAARHS